MAIMKKVLVVGASGYLGRYAVHEFKERGFHVTVLVRNPEKIKTPGPYGEPAVFSIADEIIVRDVAFTENLNGLCEGIDIVFSWLDMISPHSKLDNCDVDHLDNRRILHQAVVAKVSRFIYVSVFNEDKMHDLPLIRAHELFVADLKASGLSWAVICPNGYFSDMGRYFSMARTGHMFMAGRGDKKMNPVHGADIAKVCADAVNGDCRKITVGGPDIYTFREIMELAFHACGKTPWITQFPVWLVDGIHMAVRFFNSNLADLMSFAVEAVKIDHVAPSYGNRHLKNFFAELAIEPK